MSHHFDTPTGREDPRLNLCDFYLFAGEPGRTVMAMTVNPAVQPGAAAFRDEAVHAFRFDTDGDGIEDVSFEVRVAADQSLTVHRAGELLAAGPSGATVAGDQVRVFAGVRRDIFAGDGHALEAYEAAFGQGRYEPEQFGNHQDLFAGRHIGAIVLEVPTALIGESAVHAWATVSLRGHAPEVQVARWGLPLITHLLIRGDAMREDFNRSTPTGGEARFREHIEKIVTETVRRAGTAAAPEVYGRRLADRLGALTLPYELGSPASFDFTGFNGRAPADDVMDVMLSLVTNSALADGVAPDPKLIGAAFPYFTE
jgi:hypothetical protein